MCPCLTLLVLVFASSWIVGTYLVFFVFVFALHADVVEKRVLLTSFVVSIEVTTIDLKECSKSQDTNNPRTCERRNK